ncbi:MAG: hypothetical protein AABZ60_25240 [Planctomycetota bacterium]
MFTRLFFLLLGGVFLLNSLSADELMFVKTKSANLKDKPRGTAKDVAKLPFKAKVNITKKDNLWREVNFEGKSGWILKTCLSAEEPPEDPSLTAKDGSRYSSEDVDAQSAVRGVSPTASKFADANGISQIHRDYLDYHQSFVISDRVLDRPGTKNPITEEDLNHFLEEGKIGEYAE